MASSADDPAVRTGDGWAVAHIDAETPEEAARASAVWVSSESRAACAAQRRKLGMRDD